jgi:hypothetical protein
MFVSILYTPEGIFQQHVDPSPQIGSACLTRPATSSATSRLSPCDQSIQMGCLTSSPDNRSGEDVKFPCEDVLDLLEHLAAPSGLRRGWVVPRASSAGEACARRAPGACALHGRCPRCSCSHVVTRVALGVEVDEEHFPARRGRQRDEVGRAAGLADIARAVGERDDDSTACPSTRSAVSGPRRAPTIPALQLLRGGVPAGLGTHHDTSSRRPKEFPMTEQESRFTDPDTAVDHVRRVA